MRPRSTAALGEPGISRFPREVLPYVHRVSDRVGLRCTSRYHRMGLSGSSYSVASRNDCRTRLNTRPAPSLANASTPPSRATPHDSRPMWVATSHLYDSFIPYASPVNRRTGGSSCTPMRQPGGRTRVPSVRQLPTDHDYAARPANIRLINRRKSYLDRYPLYLRKANNS